MTSYCHSWMTGNSVWNMKTLKSVGLQNRTLQIILLENACFIPIVTILPGDVVSSDLFLMPGAAILWNPITPVLSAWNLDIALKAVRILLNALTMDAMNDKMSCFTMDYGMAMRGRSVSIPAAAIVELKIILIYEFSYAAPPAAIILQPAMVLNCFTYLVEKSYGIILYL